METKKSLIIPNTLSKSQSMIIFFFAYAFIGWLMETAYALYELGVFHKRGFLFGPICPIYGFGAVILLLFLTRYKENSIRLFVISAIVFSLFEYIVGFALDALFAAKWWDYSNEFFNLNGRISILFSFVWGIIALIFINHIHPFVAKHIEKLLENIPYWIKANSIRLIAIVFLVDTVLSSIKYLSII